jgi:hypothetical protein
MPRPAMRRLPERKNWPIGIQPLCVLKRGDEANRFSHGPPERTFGGGFGGRFAKVARH